MRATDINFAALSGSNFPCHLRKTSLDTYLNQDMVVYFDNLRQLREHSESKNQECANVYSGHMEMRNKAQEKHVC